MGKSRKALREEVKEIYVNKLIDFFREDEQVLRTGSNEIAFPVVDSEGNEDFIVITVKIPTGANKGTEPYDGYSMAEEYEIKCRQKAELAAKRQAEKEKKIKRDEEFRRKKKEAAEKRNEKQEEVGIIPTFSILKIRRVTSNFQIDFYLGL